MKRTGETALGLAEVLVALAIVIILAWLALPSVVNAFGHDQKIRSFSNMKQLHIATQQMAMDNAQTSKVGWPGDMGGSFTSWTRALAEGGYFTTNDLRKLFSASERIIRSDETPTTATSAVLVYAVKETSATNTVFLTTANFTNTPSGGAQPLAEAKPYGKKGFVVFRRGGDGVILMARQAGDTNLIGGFAPLCR